MDHTQELLDEAGGTKNSGEAWTHLKNLKVEMGEKWDSPAAKRKSYFSGMDEFRNFKRMKLQKNGHFIC